MLYKVLNAFGEWIFYRFDNILEIDSDSEVLQEPSKHYDLKRAYTCKADGTQF